MPIFEYSCEDCGTKFEKLVRRSASISELACPSCGKAHLTQQYSTFAARANSGKSEAPQMGCGNGMCQPGICGGGASGMN